MNQIAIPPLFINIQNERILCVNLTFDVKVL